MKLWTLPILALVVLAGCAQQSREGGGSASNPVSATQMAAPEAPQGGGAYPGGAAVAKKATPAVRARMIPVKEAADVRAVELRYAGDPGHSWEIACAELCGARHAYMRGRLYVHPTREDFEAWTKSEAFRLAHRGAGDNKPLYLGHPRFEGFEVLQTVAPAS